MIPRNDHIHYLPPCLQETGDSPRAVGFFCFPAPKGQNEIAQGKAKRPPGLVDAWISAPLSSAPSGRESISTFEPTGRCPGLSPCAPLGQKARNQGQSPRDKVINTTMDCHGVFSNRSMALRGRACR